MSALSFWKIKSKLRIFENNKISVRNLKKNSLLEEKSQGAC